MLAATLPLRVALNNGLIAVGLDGAYVKWRHEWKSRPYARSKSLQENVGFSHRDDVDEALKRVHERLRQTIERFVPATGKILDIGSGTGLVARQLTDRWNVVGLDISASLTDVARQTCPSARFTVGDILDTDVGNDFHFAYSIGVLCYIPPGSLREYLRRVAMALAQDGVFFLQYPHAITWRDQLHPNLLYTKYSPRVVAQTASEFFEIIEHRHSFCDDHPVETYDRHPFKGDSFVNGYMLIGRKR